MVAAARAWVDDRKRSCRAVATAAAAANSRSVQPQPQPQPPQPQPQQQPQPPQPQQPQQLRSSLEPPSSAIVALIHAGDEYDAAPV